MRSSLRFAAAPAVLSLALVAGCNNGSEGAAASNPSGGASATAVSCPTSNTRSFAKTRFVTDIGLTVGTFHRWIWKPYKAGTFHKGAHGRIKAVIKGAAIAALDLKLMDNAKKNVEANPTLCKVLGTPIEKASSELGGLKGKITSGNLASLSGLESTLSGIMHTGNDKGLGITESTDQSNASQG